MFAPICAGCGALLDHPIGGPVCAACWASIVLIPPPWCDRCGDPTVGTLPADASICESCKRARRIVDRARAVGEYEGALRAIVHAMKYDGRRSLARRLGALMRERAADLLDGSDCVVPVPLHPSRRRTRGFNQAEDLAGHLGLPVVKALRRVRATAAQADLLAAERQANVRQAFAANRTGRDLGGAIVVLVDDVSTTGATLDACAAALKTVGVAEVRAVTAARVVTSRP